MNRFHRYLMVVLVVVLPSGCDRDGDGFVGRDDCDDSNPDIGDGTYVGDLDSDWSSLCSIGCERLITGSLVLNTASKSDIASLTCLVEVHRDVIVESNDDINNFSGLDSLKHIGGDLVIDRSDFLTSLKGLEKLAKIDGNIEVSYNDNLRTLQSIGDVTSIGFLTIYGNYSLSDLSGLEGLVEIRGSLDLLGNLSLSDVWSLHNVTRVGGYFVLSGNPSLCESDAYKLLETIGEENIGVSYGIIDLKDC